MEKLSLEKNLMDKLQERGAKYRVIRFIEESQNPPVSRTTAIRIMKGMAVKEKTLKRFKNLVFDEYGNIKIPTKKVLERYRLNDDFRKEFYIYHIEKFSETNYITKPTLYKLLSGGTVTRKSAFKFIRELEEKLGKKFELEKLFKKEILISGAKS